MIKNPLGRHIVYLMLTFGVVIILIIVCKNPKQEISLIKNSSQFSNFEIKDNIVNLYCDLTVKNHAKMRQYFRIIASFSKDVEIGLLKDDILVAVDSNTGEEIFSLEIGETKAFNVKFVGHFAGNPIKSDRLLPLISFSIIDSNQNVDYVYSPTSSRKLNPAYGKMHESIFNIASAIGGVW